MAAQDLCTLSDVKTALEITDSARDTLISALITPASVAIMNEVDRQFAPKDDGPTTYRFRVDGLSLTFAPHDLRSATTVVLNPEGSSPQTLTATTDYQLLPIGAPSGTYTGLRFSSLLASIYGSQTAFSYGYALCDITGAWGFASVPADVNRACIVTVGAWLRRDISQLFIAGEPELGGGLAPTFPTTLEIPNAAKRLLDPYYRLRSWVAV